MVTPNKFKTVDTKIVISQMYKSRDIMTIAMLRNINLISIDPIEDYCIKLTKLVNSLAKIYKNLEEIPISRYIEPSIHLNDISHYITSNRNVFPSKQEQVIVDKILTLISQTKKDIKYEEE